MDELTRERFWPTKGGSVVDKYAKRRPARPRECYRADGVPKRALTRIEARNIAAEHPGYHAYRCRDCGRWHVGRWPA